MTPERESFSRRCKEEIIYISQKNIGVSQRSTPATYLGVADEIRKIFARRCKVKASMFSFNGAVVSAFEPVALYIVGR